MFNIFPRVKQYTENGGMFCADSLKVFMLGKGELFFSTLEILLPEASVEKVRYKDANVRISVSED